MVLNKFIFIIISITSSALHIFNMNSPHIFLISTFWLACHYAQMIKTFDKFMAFLILLGILPQYICVAIACFI